jgi:hypothetical protein
MSTELFVEDRSQVPALGEALKKNQPLQIFKPGDTVAYSNFGAALAGYIVERVSGQDYGDYVVEHIFTPLGMKHTAIKADHSDNEWVEERWVNEQCYAINPLTAEKTELDSFATSYGIYAPAGSATGTLEDFALFTQALIPDENSPCILFEKDSTLRAFFEPSLYYANGIPRNAHGMWSEQIGNGLYGHSGNSAGFSSIFLIDPVAQKALVIMANVTGESVFSFKLPPVYFGAYDWGSQDLTSYEDISGNYTESRGCTPHGVMKITRFVDNSTIVKAEQGDAFYLYGEKDLILTPIAKGVFVLSFDGMDSYFFVADDGRTLQAGAQDWLRTSDGTYRLDGTMLNLMLLAAAFALAVLLTKAAIFVIKKIRKSERYQAAREKYQLLSLSCCVTLVGLFLIADADNIFTSFSALAVFGVLGTILAFVAFILGIIQLKTENARSRTKLLRVATLVIAAIMLTNVLYWEFYNFWSF